MLSKFNEKKENTKIYKNLKFEKSYDNIRYNVKDDLFEFVRNDYLYYIPKQKEQVIIFENGGVYIFKSFIINNSVVEGYYEVISNDYLKPIQLVKKYSISFYNNIDSYTLNNQSLNSEENIMIVDKLYLIINDELFSLPSSTKKNFLNY